MGKSGWGRSFSKVCRQKGISAPEDLLRHNIKHMITYFDQTVIEMKSNVIQKIRNQISKDKSMKIRGKGLASFTCKGKHRSGKYWWRTWSSLAGGLDSEGNDREATGCMAFVDTYVPEAIFDKQKKHIRKRKPSDPEPKPCALLLKIMAEEFPGEEQSDAGEVSMKVEGIATKTEVVKEEIPDNTGRKRSTNNRFDPYSNRQNGYEGSRAGYGGYGSDRMRGNSSGQYGCARPRTGYGGYNSDRLRGSAGRGQLVYGRSNAGRGSYNSGRW